MHMHTHRVVVQRVASVGLTVVQGSRAPHSAPPLPSTSYFPSTRPCTHSGINRAGGCQEGCHVFDLTWFCSHMFATSGEHPLLPFFSLLSFAWMGFGEGGVPAAVQLWADIWGGELVA